MTADERWTIAKARADQLPLIAALENRWGVTPAQLEGRYANRGFLLHPLLGEEGMGHIMKRQFSTVLCAMQDGALGGYAIAYDLMEYLRQTPPGEGLDVSDRNLLRITSGSPAYLNQIAVDPRLTTRGVADELFGELCGCLSDDGYGAVLAAVLQKPVSNKPSMRFMDRNGFAPVGTNAQTAPDGTPLVWTVYFKELDA